MASITILADGQEQKYSLDTEAVTLGRGLESDIRLKDIKASRRHCQILRTPQGFQCLDLSSGNGTFVNGVQIKQHKLSPGDKIQIGSTTITFFDNNHAAAPAKTRTGQTSAKLPKVTTSAAPKPTTGKLPTAQVPTRKITAKIDVAKAQTQAMPSKSGTGPVPRATTSSLKKITQRAGSTRSMGQASATQRLMADARKKKASPVAILIGLIGAAFLVTIGIIFLGGGEDPEIQLDQIKHLATQGNDLDSQNKLDEAIRKFEEALAIAENSGEKKVKAQAVHLKARIKDLRDQAERFAGAEKAYKEWKAKFDSDKVPPRQLWDDGKKLEQSWAGADVPWAKDFKLMLEKVDNLLREAAAENRRMDFQAYRAEVIKNQKLDNESVRAGNAQWSGALKAWKEYLEKATNADGKRKAEGELTTLNRRAKDELGLLRRRAQRKADDGKKDEAVRELEEQLPRFEGLEAEADIKKLIQELKG